MSLIAASTIAGLAICISAVWDDRMTGRVLDAAGIDREFTWDDRGYDGRALEERVDAHELARARSTRVEFESTRRPIARSHEDSRCELERIGFGKSRLDETPPCPLDAARAALGALVRVSCPPECTPVPAATGSATIGRFRSSPGLIEGTLEALMNEAQRSSDRSASQPPIRRRTHRLVER